MDTPQNYLMNTVKHPVLVGVAVVAAVIGGSLLWAQQGKSTPTPVPAKAANAGPTAAAPAMAMAPQRAATPVAADPWAATELKQKKARESARDTALQSLTLPPSQFCRAEGRRNLVNALVNYFDQRATQQRQYASNWGDAGKGFIASAWGSAADQQVEAKMRTVYAAGYFRLNDFRPSQREAMTKILSEIKQARSNPCIRKA